MAESEASFMERIQVIFQSDKVFVYNSPKMIGEPKIWRIQQARQYLNHLEQERLN